jgi:hypothetical protein
VADDGAGDGAEGGLFELGLVPVGELALDLVPPGADARAARTQDGVGGEAEGEEDGLLEPLVGVPVVAVLFGDAEGAVVEEGERGADGVGGRAALAGGQAVAGVPGGLDGGLQIGDVGHEVLALLASWR